MPHADLSLLPVPTVEGLDLTLDEEHAIELDWLRNEFGWRVANSPADPAWRATRMFAARLTEHRGAVRDAMKRLTLAYADGPYLDHVGVTYFRGAVRHAGESDDDFRDRLAHSNGLVAVGLTGAWYEGIARRVAGVADARAVSRGADHVPPEPEGTVRIYVLADETLVADGATLYPRGIPDATLVTAVRDAATARDAAQQLDTVIVEAAARQRWDATVTLTVAPGAASAAVLQAARVRLAAYGARAANLGMPVSKTLIAAAAASGEGVSEGVVVLSTVSEDQVPVVAAVEGIAAADGVAPEPRNLVVAAA